MRLREFLSEAPLQDFGLIGDRNVPGSFRADDLRAASSEKWLKNLGTAFAKTKQKFNIYMLNAPVVKKGMQGHPDFTAHTIAEPHPGENTSMMVGIDHYRAYAQAYSPEGFKRIFGFVPPSYEDSVSVLFTFNEGDGRVPFTQWMVAHRLIHAIYNGMPRIHNTADKIRALQTNMIHYAADVLSWTLPSRTFDDEDEGFDLGSAGISVKSPYVAAAVGNTRALRTSNLTQAGEWFPEHGAEYLIKGRVTLRRLDLHGSTRVCVNYKVVTQEEVDAKMKEFEDGLNALFATFFAECVGSIFVI
jgi:hypothetical protein